MFWYAECSTLFQRGFFMGPLLGEGFEIRESLAYVEGAMREESLGLGITFIPLPNCMTSGNLFDLQFLCFNFSC